MGIGIYLILINIIDGKIIATRSSLSTGFWLAGGLMAMRYIKLPVFAQDGKPWKWSREAMFYTPTARGIRCQLCPNECTIRPGETGDCRNRVNYKGKLYTIAYGNPCAVHVDPIEKKPLYHYLPGTKSFSIATAGCNFACLNCQNWEISCTETPMHTTQHIPPQQAIEMAKGHRCEGIAWTYNEPTIWFEYTLESAKLAKQNNLYTVYVTNGFMSPEALDIIAPYLDVWRVDIKGFQTGPTSGWLKSPDGGESWMWQNGHRKNGTSMLR